MPSRDLSTTILSVRPGLESSKCLEIPQNQPFITGKSLTTLKRKDRGGTPHLTPQNLEITVQTTNIPRRKTRGWIFGSNPKECDCVLDTDKERGVSGTHFEIFHNWTSLAVMIRNLSSHDFAIKINNSVDYVNQGDQRALCNEISTIEVGALIFYLEIPDRGELQSLYEQNLQAYHKSIENDIPDIGSLVVKRQGRYTPAVRGVLAKSTTSPPNRYHRRWPPVGSGSTGAVYNAIDRLSGSEVAVKEFHPKRATDQILLEIDILLKTKHLHITRYIEFVKEPSPQLVMEFVHGGSLADLPDVSRHETILMAQQTSQAVSYLHDQGITHRDIKPDNILVPSRGQEFFCKIADFGESSYQSTLITSRGTPMYQAPEINNPPYDNSVDIWSLGIILVEYWYNWIRRCLNELSETPHDDWMPDTDIRTPSPSRADDFRKSKFKSLNWTQSRRKRWHSALRDLLQKEGEVEIKTENNCSMARILLKMLEVDPAQRWIASTCRYHLENLSLSETYGEVKYPHKRDTSQEEKHLGFQGSLRRVRLNPKIVSAIKDRENKAHLCQISEESMGAEGHQFQPLGSPRCNTLASYELEQHQIGNKAEQQLSGNVGTAPPHLMATHYSINSTDQENVRSPTNSSNEGRKTSTTRGKMPKTPRLLDYSASAENSRKRSAEKAGLDKISRKVPIDILNGNKTMRSSQLSHDKAVSIIRKDETLRLFYMDCLKNLQQLGCREVAKVWIKLLEPRKKSTHPYVKGNGAAPLWWPAKTRHIGPDRMQKQERITLLIHVLTIIVDQNSNNSTPVTVSKLKQVTDDAMFAWFQKPENTAKSIFLQDIFYVAALKERYPMGELSKFLIFPPYPYYPIYTSPDFTKEAANPNSKHPRYQQLTITGATTFDKHIHHDARSSTMHHHQQGHALLPLTQYLPGKSSEYNIYSPWVEQNAGVQYAYLLHPPQQVG